MKFTIHCGACEYGYSVMSGRPSEHRECPNCSSAFLHVTAVVEEVIQVAPDLEVRGRDPNLSKTQAKKSGVDIKSGQDWCRDLGRFVYRYREINRPKDRYIEFVHDRETGKVLRWCNERLTDHQSPRRRLRILSTFQRLCANRK